MKTQAFDFSTIDQLHEHLCLDFVNSTSNHQNLEEDYFKSYADLISWSLDVKLLGMDEAQHLWEVFAQQPAHFAELYEKAIVLREAIYHILLDVTQNQPPKPADLMALNMALAKAMSHMQLEASNGGFDWAWDYDMGNPEIIIWRVAWSAGELLRSDKIKHIRKCDGCDWLFLDTGRGHRRRWCDMNTCGNRAKSRRHYSRTRGK